MNYLYNLINNNVTAITRTTSTTSATSATSEITATETYKFLIPNTIEEFKKKFIETPHLSDGSDIVVYDNPKTEKDLHVTIIVSVLHSALCCVRDKIRYNSQVFHICKAFSEEILRAAQTKARADALVVIVKKKNLEQLPSPYFLSNKYRHRLISLTIPYIVFDKYYQFLENSLNIWFGEDQQNESKSCDLTAVNNGKLLFIGEGLAKKFWDLIMTSTDGKIYTETQELTALSETLMSENNTQMIDSAENSNSDSERQQKETDLQDDNENVDEDLEDVEQDLVINLPTLKINLESIHENSTKKVDFYNLSGVPECIVETSTMRDSIIQKIMSDCVWKYTENTFATLLQQGIWQSMNFSPIEITQLEEVYNFIEPHKLGVELSALINEFPNREFLSRALNAFEENYLIKRVGVANLMFVHKTFIRSWIVHTFHLKRCDREKMQQTKVIPLLTKLKTIELKDKELPSKSILKRKRHDSENLEEDKEKLPKKRVKIEENNERLETIINEVKTDTANTTTVKNLEDIAGELRKSSRPKCPKISFDLQYNDEENEDNVVKDVIVLKPRPWIRPDGTLNRRVLDRWMGAILTECIARNGCTVQAIFIRFCNMYPVDIMFLLNLLQDMKCIELKEMKLPQIDLFTLDIDEVTETNVYDLYVPERTYITAAPDAVMRMSVFIGKKTYQIDFV